MLSQAYTYTPEEVSTIIKVSKSTVYELIKAGDIIAKKIGRVYRIPAASLSFAFTGLDNDLYSAEQEDLKLQDKIQKELSMVRKSLIK